MRHRIVLGIAVSMLAVAWEADAQSSRFADIRTYDRADFSQEVTECDRQAAHPSDPEAISAGVTRADMDKPAAIAACLEALRTDPDNPRLNYQLARAYGYSGLHEDGDAYRLKALNSGYPQSLFVVGYIRIEGWDGRPEDVCYGGELVRRSAHAGRFAGLVGFPHYVQTGRLDNCPDYPMIDMSEIQGFLDDAEKRADGYYQSILVESLKTHFKKARKDD